MCAVAKNMFLASFSNDVMVSISLPDVVVVSVGRTRTKTSAPIDDNQQQQRSILLSSLLINVVRFENKTLHIVL